MLCLLAAVRKDRRLQEEASRGAVQHLVVEVCSQFAGGSRIQRTPGAGLLVVEGIGPLAVVCTLAQVEAGIDLTGDSIVQVRILLPQPLEHSVVG